MTRPTEPQTRLLLLAVIAVIAVGVTGVGILLPPAELDLGGARAVQLAGAAALIAGVVWLYFRGKRLSTRRRGVPDAAGAALFRAGTLMALIAAIAAFTSDTAVDVVPTVGNNAAIEDAVVPDPPIGNPVPRRERTRDPTGRGGLGASVDPLLPGPAAQPQPAGEDAVFGWGLSERMQNILLLIILLGFVFMRFIGSRGRSRSGGWGLGLGIPRGRRFVEDDEEPSEEAAFNFEMPPEGGNARQAITRAYYRLLEALRRLDAPRLAHEAPHEHMVRTVSAMGVAPRPLHHLTDLYVAAQFSERSMSAQTVAEANRALGDSLAALDAVAAGAQTADHPDTREAPA